MSSFSAEHHDAAQVRDLEVREYMEQIDGSNHPAFASGLLCDGTTGRWLQPEDNLLLTHPRAHRAYTLISILGI